MPDLPTASSDFTDVRGILAGARRAAYTAVNSAMVAAYWQIGRRIVEEEQGGAAKATYGEGLLKELSKALTAEFGKGFSLANLKNFWKFYLTYPDGGKSYALRSLLSWTHHRLIMHVENPLAREHYITHAEQENWSTRTLERQIETRTFQRLLTTQDTVSVPESPQSKSSIRDFLKDPYVLEFLRLFDDLKRGPDDNPTIGLILCADKDETIVQYLILKGSEQLFASKYRTVLPTEAELVAELERERRNIEEHQNGGDK